MLKVKMKNGEFVVESKWKYLVPSILVIGAVLMAINNLDDWGWVIFAALIALGC